MNTQQQCGRCGETQEMRGAFWRQCPVCEHPAPIAFSPVVVPMRPEGWPWIREQRSPYIGEE